MEEQLIQTSEGAKKVMMCQFIISPHQQICVVGLDERFASEVKAEVSVETEVEYIGKLDEQNTVFQKVIINSLNGENWNFLRFPNPSIFLLTKKDDSKIIIHPNLKQP